MRIAVVSGNREVVGGAEAYLRWLLPALLSSGYDVAAFFERDAAAAERKIDRGFHAARSSCLAALGAEAWKRELSSFDPALVYLHGVHDPGIERWLAQRFRTIAYA